MNGSPSPVPDLDLRDAAAVCARLEQATECLRNSPLRRGCTMRLPRGGSLLATGDLHDNQHHLAKIIQFARLNESPDHHLVLQELIHGERLINGMDFSHRMIIKVAGLVLQFPHQVHPLLANHEMSQMTGRGVSKGAGNSVKLFNDAVEFVYGEDAPAVSDALNGFFRVMALALISENGLGCAHSLPNARMMRCFDSGILDRELMDDDFISPAGGAYLMTWGRTYNDESVKSLAEAWGVNLFLLGHQRVECGCEARNKCGNRVIVLNSDHERGAILPLDLTRPPPNAQAVQVLALPLSAVAHP